ncbi:NAD(P)/FAD-dependent oxidoreductase [Candidatus Saccharibacteria bacterium]|nr:NAD(P)/FAD-dependent oxidoreductase [Candidatus Saccharibacteria bacterium]MCB9821070.1 NAD(P)/FAD-dependent oxidoreductase [Candidatus Nomurabacteria bacterium]
MENPTKKIVIIGAGTAGIMLSNKLVKHKLDVTVIDSSEVHYYQPGFLFLPFGKYNLDKLRRPLSKLINKKVTHLRDRVASINYSGNSLTTESGQEVGYDILVIATGTHIDASATQGLSGAGWRKNIFDFYTPDGAMALREALQNFTQGKLVVQIMDMPIKCPVAPLEFAFLADDYFRKRGLRDQIEIEYVTSLSGAFTKPVASSKLGHLLTDKNINIVADFYVEKVDPEARKLICYDGREVNYDLLVTIPVNAGADFLHNSEIANELGFVEVNHGSLQSTKYPNLFAIGDAADLPTSKAGSVAHFEVETLVENIMRSINGQPLEESFDGHSNCFVEAGGGKALLLDFNYQTEPLEGRFPFAMFGPMKLLNPSRINHLGKLAFRYIYWYMLLPGRKIPFIPNKMSIKGKKQPKIS